MSPLPAGLSVDELRSIRDVRRLVSEADGVPSAEAVADVLGFGSEPEFVPSPIAFDFDALPEPPDWVVHGTIERGTLAILSGDTGSAKSILSQWLTVKALRGEDWFGRGTSIERVLVVDEENADGLVTARLRAMGLTNDERDRLRYFSREGMTIGEDATNQALDTELREFAPDLVVVDTLMSASSVDVMDNTAATAFMKRLRALARLHGCAVLVLHHERKQQKDGPAAGSSQQTMGARQIVGQSDATLTIAVESDMQRDESEDGGMKLRRTFKFRSAEKDRDGRYSDIRRIAVESEKDDRGRLLWMEVADEGPLASDSAQENDEAVILATLREGGEPMSRKKVASGSGQKNPDKPTGTFLRAWGDLKERGLIEKRGAKFVLTEEGNKASGLPV